MYSWYWLCIFYFQLYVSYLFTMAIHYFLRYQLWTCCTRYPVLSVLFISISSNTCYSHSFIEKFMVSQSSERWKVLKMVRQFRNCFSAWHGPARRRCPSWVLALKVTCGVSNVSWILLFLVSQLQIKYGNLLRSGTGVEVRRYPRVQIYRRLWLSRLRNGEHEWCEQYLWWGIRPASPFSLLSSPFSLLSSP